MGTNNWINLFNKQLALAMDRIGSDPQFGALAVGVALFVVIITLVILRILWSKSGGRSASALVLVGLSEAGKTLLFSQLVSNRFVNTVTSMRQNEGQLNVTPNKAITLLDLPGYERLRNHFWDLFRDRARAVIFVVDSLGFAANGRDVTEWLYTVLADLGRGRGQKVPLLVACNKQDEPKAKSAKILQKQMEKEMGLIRETRLAALDSTDGEGDGDAFGTILGNPDKDFSFSDLRTPVLFVDCSCLGSDEDESRSNQLEAVRAWIQKVA
jgi:small GTP-binding protein